MDEPLILKTAVISEENNDKNTVIETWTEAVENQNGHVFYLIEITGPESSGDIIKDIIKDRLNRLAATIQEKTNVPHRFEQTISAINEDLTEKASEIEMPFLNNVMVVLGVAVGKVMYLSGVGNLTAVFLHKRPDQKYQIFNLSRNIETEQEHRSWQKLFSVVLDGDLHPQDIFYISNLSLSQEIEPEELNNILTTLPPQGAAIKIRQSFPLDTNLALFIMKVEGKDEQFSPISAPASLQQLRTAREQTDQILSEQKPTFLKNFFRKILNSILKNKGIKKLFKFFLRLVVSSIKLIFVIIFDVIKWSGYLGKKLASAKRKEVFEETNNKIKKAYVFVTGRFVRLPKTSKYLIVAALGLVLVLSGSLLLISRGREAAEERAAFEKAIAKTETLINEASGSLIYKNESRAKTVLKEASTVLSSITVDRPEEEKKIQDLSNQIKKISDSLLRINEVSPETIASLSSITNPPTISAIAFLNGEIYTLGSDKVIYKINSNNKTFESTSLNETAGSGLEASSEDQFIFWLDDRVGLDVFEPNEKKLTATDIKPNGNEKWVDLYAYADRIYVLATNSGLASQIYKVAYTGTDLGQPVSWLKSPTSDLSDAVSLAVDGTVFALRNNGKILRFVGGRDVAWTQGEVEPALTSATDLWTSANSSYLYILDPTGQRVIVYEKETGNLKIQYHNPTFANLSDFIIDEANKIIYLLGNGNVYKIEASQLK